MNNYLEIWGTEILSERCYGRRKILLILALIAIFIYRVGFIPKKISWAGVELTGDQLLSLKIVVIVSLIYLILSFITNASLEVLMWAVGFLKSDDGVNTASNANTMTSEDIISKMRKDKKQIIRNRMSFIALLFVFIKIFIEYLLPIIVGIVSLCLILV